MCGIVGLTGAFDGNTLSAMTNAIAHRGPDDAGFFHEPENAIGLGHRRLSILDLSPLGHQPMTSANGRYTIVYNGELYNYRELRAKLEAVGTAFRGKSDTEVLLNFYAERGTEILGVLNGIFAFAIWDRQKRELLLARDRRGTKPLYYSEMPGTFVFASEIKALMSVPGLDRSLDGEALARYVTYLYCPAPATPLKHVRKVLPGTAIVVKDAKIIRRFSFHEGDGSQPVIADKVSAVENVHDALRLAVSRQLVSDVPVGAFLSGGVDSSSIAVFARQLSSSSFPCFTIDVSRAGGNTDGFADDLPYARAVAKHIDVDLHVVEVNHDMMDHLQEMIFFLDEPQGDPAPINAMLICRLARNMGVKVLLSGAGGDDIFSGYRRHLAISRENIWSGLPQPVRAALGAAAARLPVHNATLRRGRKAFQNAGHNAEERLAGYFAWLDPSTVANLFSREFVKSLAPETIIKPFIERARELHGATSLQKMLALEQAYFLADHNLNYTDKMSMSTGVEVRVPFLDDDLVALAARIPDHFKQRGRTGKWVLKEAMRRYLPADVVDRPKTGFGAPLRYWMRTSLRPLIDDVLSPQNIAKRGIFNATSIARLVEMDRRGEVDAAYPIFAVVCIELWCRIFLDQNARHPV